MTKQLFYLIFKSIYNFLSTSTFSAYKSAFYMYHSYKLCYCPFLVMCQSFTPVSPTFDGFYRPYFQLSQLAALSTSTVIFFISFTFQIGITKILLNILLLRKRYLVLKKSKPSSDSRIPFNPTILLQLVNDLQHTSSSHFLRILLKAMFIFAFFPFCVLAK